MRQQQRQAKGHGVEAIDASTRGPFLFHLKGAWRSVVETPTKSGASLVPANMAAQQLGLQAQTLASWRLKGRGPRHVKVGSRVMYRQADIDLWIESNVRSSTSDGGSDQ